MKRLRKHYRLLCKDTIKLIPPSLMLHIFLADGFEDIEAIAPIDILRRCRLDVRTVSISDSLNVTSARRVARSQELVGVRSPAPTARRAFPPGRTDLRYLRRADGVGRERPA